MHEPKPLEWPHRLIPKLEWKEQGTYINLGIRRWDEGGYILFDLVIDGNGLLARATQPFHRNKEFPNPDPGCFWIKSYSEHRGLGDALVQAEVIERTGRTVIYGPWNASSHEYRFTPAYADELYEYVATVGLTQEETNWIRRLFGLPVEEEKE